MPNTSSNTVPAHPFEVTNTAAQAPPASSSEYMGYVTMNPTANSAPAPSNSPHSSSFSVSVAAVGAEIHDMTLISCEIAPAFDTWSALVDTGAQINLISHSNALLLSAVIRPSTISSFTGVDGSPSLPVGETTLAVRIGSLERPVLFYVVEKCTSNIILGCPAIHQFGMTIDICQNVITLDDKSRIPIHSNCIPAVASQKYTIAANGVAAVRLQDLAIQRCPMLFHGFENAAFGVPEGLIKGSEEPFVLVCNALSRPIRIRKGQIIGELSLISNVPTAYEVAIPPTAEENHQNVKVDSSPLSKIKFGPNLSAKEFALAADLMKEFEDVFGPITGPADLPPMPIELEEDHPIVARPNSKEPYRHTEWLRSTIESMLASRIIRFSQSAFHSPIVIVRKPHNRGWRLCVDYRKINASTKPIYTVVPDAEQILASVKGFSHMTSFDLTSGYWQLPILVEHAERTAFSTSFGTFEFLAAPMGLRNVPHHFNRAITSVFQLPITEGWLKAYFDDLNVFSRNFQEHLNHLRCTLTLFRKHKLRANPEKALIAATEGPCLGFIVNGITIRPGQEKSQAIVDMPRPSDASEIRTFMGMASWFRRFIPDLARRALPLTHLTQKDTPFTWSKVEEEAFQFVKSTIAKAIELHHFDPSAPATVISDASEKGWSASLSQFDKVIAFASGTFTPTQSRYATHERECLGALSGLDKFRHYLLGAPVTLITDSRAISWLRKSKELTPKLFRWSQRIEEFSPTIIHRPGPSIATEDCGSRLPSPLHMTVDPIDAFEESNYVSSAPLIATMKSSHTSSTTVDSSIASGPSSQDEKNSLVARAHKHPSAGHFGQAATVERLRKFANWPNLVSDVQNFIRSCDCQLTKSYPRIKPSYGSTLSYKLFDRIGIDFLGPFPVTPRNNRFILIIEELFSHALFAIAVPRATLDTLQYYLRLWISQNDVPHSVISDHATAFDGPSAEKFWESLNIHKIVTAPYHQSTNGATERAVGTLKNRLRSITPSFEDWDLSVSDAVFAINNHRSGTTGFSPHEVRFGRIPRGEFHPREPLDPAIIPLETIDNAIRRKHCITDDAHNVISHSYSHGDLVKLKVDKPSHFLSPLWKGPFRISKISNHFVDLLDDNGILQSTHIDKIAPFHTRSGDKSISDQPPLQTLSKRIPPVKSSRSKSYVVERIVDHRVDPITHDRLFLVKWEGYPSTENTWEPASNFDQLSLLTSYMKKHNLH